MKTWLKGGLIGLGVGVVIILISILHVNELLGPVPIRTCPLDMENCVIESEGLLYGIPYFIGELILKNLILWIILSFLIGIIIGLIIQKIKSKKQEQK